MELPVTPQDLQCKHEGVLNWNDDYMEFFRLPEKSFSLDAPIANRETLM